MLYICNGNTKENMLKSVCFSKGCPYIRKEKNKYGRAIVDWKPEYTCDYCHKNIKNIAVCPK